MSNKSQASRKLSYLLRHAPESEISLDHFGWALVSDVCKILNLSIAVLEEIVAEDTKNRYEMSGWTARIRARQGHSNPNVKIDFERVTPPPVLYHGTPKSNTGPILEHGILAQSRQYVHLSSELQTAQDVARRRGPLITIFAVDTKAAIESEVEFLLSSNGVWLVAHAIDRKFVSIHYESE